MRAVISVRNPVKIPEGIFERQIYRNLCLSLIYKIAEVERGRRANVDGLADDIEYYLNFPFPRVSELQRHSELAYFTRELYGVVRINTRSEKRPEGVTKKDINSVIKERDISKAGHIMMYIIYNRFNLSLGMTGIILGTPEKPKDHATVLALKKFDPEKGRIAPEDYSREEYDASDLYKDALAKYKRTLRS
jgi:hypothetical protein